MSKYFELHNHSHFSYLDGISSPRDLAKNAKRLGYPALALTDHGVIDGWYNFYKQCKAEGIVPILSCEFYMAKDENDVEEHPWKPGSGVMRPVRKHIILHAKTEGGVEAIRDLYNRSWEDFSEKGNKQLIYERDILEKAGKILVQSACTGSYFDEEDKVTRFKEAFGDDLYLEIQPHILDQDYKYEPNKEILLPDGSTKKMVGFFPCEDKQATHNKKIIEWARKHDVNLIITGDAHYPTREDKVIQDIQILNSQVGKTTGWHFFQDTNHLMDFEQWWKYFTRQENEVTAMFTKEDALKSVEIMQGIVDKCKDIELENQPSLLEFPLDTHPLFEPGDNKDRLLMKIIKDNDKIDFKNKVYLDRLKFELDVIRTKGFVDYFLIYEDIIRFNKSKGWLTGPGRGSAAGSLLAYCLDITKRDPIARGLLFERFMDISRTDFPDIDSDFEMQKETMDYIRDKYGEGHFSNIGAYQTVKVKTALKNAYRTLYGQSDNAAKAESYDYAMVNRVTKMIPETNSRGTDNQIEIFKELLANSKAEYDECVSGNKTIPIHNMYAFLKDKPDLVKATGKLLGKVTNMRVHPCSVIITKQPVADVMPLVKIKPGTKSEIKVTAFDGEGVEALGEIKFDILGLKTLNYIADAMRLIKARHGIDYFDTIWDLKTDDPEVLAATAKGDTNMVFQVNTSLLQKICVQMGQDISKFTYDDWIAVIALGRPGPLKAGFVDTYLGRKFGYLSNTEIFDINDKTSDWSKRKKVNVPYSHPKMDEILKNTYGVIVYQEQVMKIFVEVGGFELKETNAIRKAIAKGKKKNLDAARPKFEANAIAGGWTKEQVDAFFEDILGFGSYCFNLSHSECYAYLGYVCQYLKVKYPTEWWAGCLKHSGEKGVKKVLETISKEVKNVEVGGVDVNHSKNDFFLNGNKIVMPFKFLEGVGDSAVEHIIANQPYESLEGFVKKVPGRSVRKNAVISLILAGAFSELYPEMSEQDLLEYYFAKVRKTKDIEKEVFKIKGEEFAVQYIIDDNSVFERAKTKMDPFYSADWVERFKEHFHSDVINLSEIGDYADKTSIVIGGEIERVQRKQDKRKQDYFKFTLRHLDSTINCTLFASNMENYGDVIEEGVGRVIEVRGKINDYMGHRGLIANFVKEIDIY